MTIKKATYFINISIILALCVTALTFIHLSSAIEDLTQVSENRVDVQILADELRQSSVNLTDLVRIYAVTGDQRYADAYQEVLDERSGKIPRLRTRKIFAGEKRDLLKTIEQYGLSQEEMGHISAAASLSSDLVPLEVEAMNLVRGLYKDGSGNFSLKGEPNKAKAVELVFSPFYRDRVTPIMEHMDQFALLLNARTQKAVQEAQDSVAQARAVVALCLLLIFVLTCASAYYTIINVVNPLLSTTAFAHNVAEGDLRSTIEVRADNEMGQLRNTLNTMVMNLQQRMQEIHSTMEQASAKEREAQKAAVEARAAGEESQRRHEQILQVARQLENTTQMVKNAVTSLTELVEQSDQGANEQASRISSTVAAMEEMSVTVMEVARNAGEASKVSAQTRSKAQDGAAVVEKAIESIDAVQKQSATLRSDMSDLGTHAQAINDIMGVISDIADQTNLLALNAAIEAARAGEAGRGFAVVADEVRKLAEKTMSSTVDVGNAIRAIQQSAEKSSAQVEATANDIEQATMFANQSGEALKEIVALADTSADQVRNIATASEEQSATSEEISRSITDVNDIAEQTAQSMKDASAAVAGLAHEVESLNSLIISMKQ